jgi:hypothetical protein
MMRRLFDLAAQSGGCEGCGGPADELFHEAGGLVRACSPACAKAADARLNDACGLTEAQARQIEAEQHLVDGELPEGPAEGGTGLLW